MEVLLDSMAYFQFHNIRIAAINAAVPSQIVALESLSAQFGEDKVRRFKESTGIQQFHKTAEHQTASDLCYAAAENIICQKKIDRDEIGALIFVAHSADYRRPATACVLHKRLQLNKDCMAFDISLGCSALVYGLQTTCALMQSSNIHNALLLVGETLTKMTHPKDITYISEMLPNISQDVIDKMKVLQPGTCVAFGSAFKIPMICKLDKPIPPPQSSSCDVSSIWNSNTNLESTTSNDNISSIEDIASL